MKEPLDMVPTYGTPNPKFENIRLGGFLAIVGALWLLSMLYGCGEKDGPIPLEESIRGAWHKQHAGWENRYRFSIGTADAYTLHADALVWQTHYVCKYNADTIWMQDIIAGETYGYTVQIEAGGDAATFEPLDTNGLTMNLKRLK